MQQPLLEFTKFYAFEEVLNEMKKNTEKQGMIIEKQAEEIKKMKKEFQKNKRKIDRTQDVVYQLIGGLFNQEKQSDMVQFTIDYLYDKTYVSNPEFQNDPMHWENSPTTRQGDDNAERIEKLEKIMRKISEACL